MGIIFVPSYLVLLWKLNEWMYENTELTKFGDCWAPGGKGLSPHAAFITNFKNTYR